MEKTKQDIIHIRFDSDVDIITQNVAHSKNRNGQKTKQRFSFH